MDKKVKKIIETLIKVFVSSILSSIVVSNVTPTSAANIKTILGSAITAVCVFAYNWFDPKDTRYGINKK